MNIPYIVNILYCLSEILQVMYLFTQCYPLKQFYFSTCTCGVCLFLGQSYNRNMSEIDSGEGL